MTPGSRVTGLPLTALGHSNQILWFILSGAAQTATSEDSAGCRCPGGNLHAEGGGISFGALEVCSSLVVWQMALCEEGVGLAAFSTLKPCLEKEGSLTYRADHKWL